MMRVETCSPEISNYIIINSCVLTDILYLYILKKTDYFNDLGLCERIILN